MKRFYHNPTITMDTTTFNQLQAMAKQTGMTQSLIVRRLIAQAAKKMEQSPVENILLQD